MHRLGVVGWPVAHSRSPAMHNAALAELGLGDWHYQRLPLPPDVFDETVRRLPEMGFVGVNVTIPHKEAALALADTASDAARAIGAANTLTFSASGSIAADNTDAPGLLAALPESPAGRTALVFGAGGSARAVVWALREAGAAEVQVWNRTPDRAAAIAAAFGVRHVAEPRSAEILVNCTSVGLGGEPLDALPVGDLLADASTVVDLVYHDGGTALTAAAADHGCVTVDGSEILVQQGALSLAQWTGRAVPLAAMRAAVR